MFCDAARLGEKGALGFIGGLMFGDLKQGSVFHTLTWVPHLAARPTISTGSAEILAYADEISGEQVIAGLYQTLLGISVHLCSIINSEYLRSSFSTCRVPEDESM